MLSKTEENRGRTLKLRSEKEENIGALPEIGFRKREPRVQSLKQMLGQKEKIASILKQMLGREGKFATT